MLRTDEPQEWRHGPTEALCHGVNLLLEVREDMVRDVLYQEVDVPGDVVGRVDCGVDDPPLYGVAGRHGHLVYEGYGKGCRFHDGLVEQTDRLVHLDREVHKHVQVAHESGEDAGGFDLGLVGDESAVCSIASSGPATLSFVLTVVRQK